MSQRYQFHVSFGRKTCSRSCNDRSFYLSAFFKVFQKNCQKLFEKISDLIRECEVLYGIQIVYHDQISLHTLKRMRKKLYRIKKQEDISFVHGKGKRKTPLQRSIETLESYIQKLKEYIKKIHLCGTRNSYSKTDPDATFMRMKEDAMMNGQLKPAYNLHDF